jgi:hypothetical protein
VGSRVGGESSSFPFSSVHGGVGGAEMAFKAK